MEIAGNFDSPWLAEDHDIVVDPIQTFLTGTSGTVQPERCERVLASMLFTDVVASTSHAATLGDARWRTILDAHDRALRAEIARSRGREVKTTGDGFFAAFDGPARAVRCGLAAVERARKLGIDVRCGVHVGECEVRGEDLAGLAVHVAARVAAAAAPGEVMVTSTVKDLVVGSGLTFESRGSRTLKGVPGEVAVYVAR